MSERRKLSAAEIEDQQRGSLRVAPGVWIDRHGCMHFSEPELLAFFNVVDTPENREVIRRTVRESILAANPDATIVEQE
jgi:hypothetical protein